MTKLKIWIHILLLILLVSPVSFSQWSVQHFNPDSRSVFFINGTGTGYAAYVGGYIRKSTDYGQSWVNLYVNDPNFTNLAELYFININTGWAVGNDGIVHKTTNGGTNWVTSTPTPENLFSVNFYDANTGIIGCGGGKILRTTNGGTNWTSVIMSTGILATVQMINSTTGFAGSFEGIYKTTNAGLNWVSFSTIADYAADMEFTDAQTGYICAGTKVYKSTNAGLNWTAVTIPGSINLNTLTFLNSSTGFVCGQDAKVYKTTNAGVNWITSYTSPRPLYGIHVQDANNVITVGTFGTISRTTNLGTNWNNVSTGSNGDIISMQFFNSTTGVLTNSDGLFMQTTNSGTNWSQLQYFNDIDFGDMFFFNSSTGWISGTTLTEGGGHCGIKKTTDGGLTWTSSLIIGISGGRSIVFPNANTGYFFANSSGHDAGSNKYLYTTTNAGANWQSVGEFSQEVEALYFNTVNNGFAAGDGGVIIKTTDAGDSWQPQSSGTTRDLSAVYFLNNNIGFVCGNEVILATTNGGTNWVQQVSAPNVYFNDITFWNANNGAAVGNNGERYYTTNGGANWVISQDPSRVPIYSVAFSGLGSVYCGGSVGYISTQGVLTGIAPAGNTIPANYKLGQNYPNPFNPKTIIEFSVPEAGNVTLSVYDITGRSVGIIIDQHMSAGSYKADFDGSMLSSGVYFYKITSNNFTDVKKMILVK